MPARHGYLRCLSSPHHNSIFLSQCLTLSISRVPLIISSAQMDFPFLVRVLPLFAILLVLGFSSPTVAGGNSIDATVTSIVGCPSYIDYYPKYPAAINGNCTAGTLLYITAANLPNTVTPNNTQVLVIGEYTHSIDIVAINATTVVVRLPSNPEPAELGWDEQNAFKLNVYIDGRGLYRDPPRNMMLWYNRSASVGQGKQQISSE